MGARLPDARRTFGAVHRSFAVQPLILEKIARLLNFCNRKDVNAFK
jgi:hypothetical protein